MKDIPYLALMCKVWDVFCEIKTDLYPTPFCPCHVVRNMFVDYTLKITTTSPRGQWVSDFICGSRHLNSSRSSDAIWQHRSGSTLAQVMACCLTAPSHYLNQRWFIVSEVLWHAPERNSQWSTKLIFCIVSWKIIMLKLLSHAGGANELTYLVVVSSWTWATQRVRSETDGSPLRLPITALELIKTEVPSNL